MDVDQELADLTRPQAHLTHELLDWLTNALTAVLSTPEVHAVLRGRPEAALLDALKQTDKLWPYAEEPDAKLRT